MKHYTDEDVEKAARMTKCSIVDGQDARNVYCLKHDNPVRGGLPHCIGYEAALEEARAVLDGIAPAIAARALRDAAHEMRDILYSGKTLGGPSDEWLMARADEIEDQP